MTPLAKKTDNENLISNPDVLYKYSVDLIVVMTFLIIAGIYLNGFNAIITTAFSVLTAVICEDIGCRIMKRHDKKAHNLYAAATGLAIAIMLPATVPAYIPVIASAFAVIAVLIPFGSARKVPFVPAAAGLSFVTVCFKEAVFTYAPITVGTSSPIFGSENFIAEESFSSMLTYGRSVIFNPLEILSLLMGRHSGPMGATCVLVLVGAGFYLLFKRKGEAVVSAAFVATCAVYAAIFPRVSSGALSSVAMELTSGTLLFCAIVLLPDPFTAPQTNGGRALYGFVGGIICMLLRRYGAFEESVFFTILMMNAISPAVGDYFSVFTSSLREKGILKEKKLVFAEIKPHKEKAPKAQKAEKKPKEKPVRKSKREKKISEAEEKAKKTVAEIDLLSYEELMNFDDTPEIENEQKEGGADE